MSDGQPFVRYSVPGYPHKSVWIPADQAGPIGHRRDREGPSWAAGIVAILSVLILSSVIICAAIMLGDRMAQYGVPQPSASFVTPATAGAPR